jgi:hypothetical protein
MFAKAVEQIANRQASLVQIREEIALRATLSTEALRDEQAERRAVEQHGHSSATPTPVRQKQRVPNYGMNCLCLQLEILTTRRSETVTYWSRSLLARSMTEMIA